MNDDYLIPANASRGKLILGYFRGIDLIIFAVGLGISLILLFLLQDEMGNTWIAIGASIPALVAIFLVLPIPYQHNVLVLLQAVYSFYFVNRQRYYWRGWCNNYGKDIDKK